MSAADNVETNEQDGSSHPVDMSFRIIRGFANEQLRSVIGPRLVKAREMSGLRQIEAAALLGYANSAQLNLWELCRRLAPLSELIKIAQLYSVPLDYLAGTTEETERDPSLALRRACLNGVRKQLERVAEITVDTVARQTQLVGPHAQHVRGLLSVGDRLLEAYAAFVRHNLKEFDDQRGSASLVRLADEFETAMRETRHAIRLHDAQDAELRSALASMSGSDALSTQEFD